MLQVGLTNTTHARTTLSLRPTVDRPVTRTHRGPVASSVVTVVCERRNEDLMVGLLGEMPPLSDGPTSTTMRYPSTLAHQAITPHCCSVRTPAPELWSGSFFVNWRRNSVSQPTVLLGSAELERMLKGSEPLFAEMVRYGCVTRLEM